MASISFSTGGYNTPINNLNNSGLGFFGAAGFGASVSVNAWNSTVFITDGFGVNQGAQGNSIQYIHPNSGVVQGGATLNLNQIPNYQGTLHINFNNQTAVRTQNAKLFIYDRISTNNAPSSVICAVAPLIHPDVIQNANGSGINTWQFPSASSYVNMSLLNNGNSFSPGLSGQSINGNLTTDFNHDFYCVMSASPSTIGSKTYFGLLFSIEYL